MISTKGHTLTPVHSIRCRSALTLNLNTRQGRHASHAPLAPAMYLCGYHLSAGVFEIQSPTHFEQQNHPPHNSVAFFAHFRRIRDRTLTASAGGLLAGNCGLALSARGAPPASSSSTPRALRTPSTTQTRRCAPTQARGRLGTVPGRSAQTTAAPPTACAAVAAHGTGRAGLCGRGAWWWWCGSQGGYGSKVQGG